MASDAENALNILLEPEGAKESELVRALDDYIGACTKSFKKASSRWGDWFGYLDGEYWEGQQEDTDRHLVTFPEIGNVIRTFAAWMTDRVPMVRAFPSELATEDDAKLMEKIYASSWLLDSWSTHLYGGLINAMTVGVGTFKAGWNLYSPMYEGKGGLELRTVEPYDILVHPSATCIDNAWGFVLVSDITYQELKRDYPDKADQVKAAARPKSLRRPRDNEGGSFHQSPTADQLDGIPGNISTAVGQTPVGASGSWSDEGQAAATSVQALLNKFTKYEVWLKDYGPDNRERWQVYCLSGRVLLSHREEREHTLADYRFFDNGTYQGVGLAEMIENPVRTLNIILTQIVTQARLSANPILVLEDRTLLNEQDWDNEPGAVAMVSTGSSGTIRWMEPPDMPSYIGLIPNMILQAIERITGVNAFSRGQTPVRREAVGVVEAMQEASFVMVRQAVRHYEAEIQRLSRKAMNLAAEFFIEGRTFPMAGPKDRFNFEKLPYRRFQVPIGPNGDPIPDEYRNVVPPVGYEPMRFYAFFESGTSMAVSKQGRQQAAMQLFEARAVDVPYLLDAFEVEDADGVMQRMSESVREQQESAFAEIKALEQEIAGRAGGGAPVSMPPQQTDAAPGVAMDKGQMMGRPME